MNNKKQVIIIGLLVTNILIVVFFSYHAKKNIDHATSEVQMIRQELYNVQQNIITNTTGHVEMLLEESNNKIDNFSTAITEIMPADKTATLKLNFEVKDLSGDGEVIVLYKTETEEEWTELETTTIDILLHEAIFLAELDENYAFRIVEKNGDRGMTQLNTETLTKNLYYEFYEQRTYIDSSGFSEMKDIFTLDYSLKNNTFGLEEFHIKSVSAKIIYQDQVLLDEEITHLNLGNREELDRRRIAIAAGEITEDEKYDHVFGVQGEEDTNMQSMSFEIKLDKGDIEKDFPGLFTFEHNGFSKDRNVSKDFKVTFGIEFNNGEEIDIDHW